MNEPVLALTTLPADFDTTNLAQDLVGTGVAACVTILPAVRSVYIWDGLPQIDQEQQVVVKTTAAQVDSLWELLKARHPYDVPEFLILPVIGGNEDYMRWIDQSVGPRPES